jgi:inner membrane protein
VANPDRSGAISSTLASSQLVRVLVVGALVLALQIPILLIDGQIRARQATRDEAVAEVTGRWGGEQRIAGPILRVPWRERREEHGPTGVTFERVTVHHALFLPDELRVVSRAKGETRQRGIFDVPLYQADVELSGRFRAPDFGDWDVRPEDILWERAELLLSVADPHALRAQPTITWGKASVPFEPGGPALGDGPPSLRARLPQPHESGTVAFQVALRINGALRLAFAPLGESTQVELSSNWPHPSFEGRWLPVERTLAPNGFDARWEVSHLGRGYPQRWREGDVDLAVLRGAELGVGFLAPVDPYRMAERSVKYELLFLALPYLAIWLFEVLAGLRVHPIQYLFVGAALCLFYLLQLSLAEHLGFQLAYVLAAIACATLITLYARAILGAGRRAAVLGGLVAGLYAFLYLLLRDEDYALLLGTLGLFAALAVAMWLTRNVDWYALERAAPRRAGAS